MLTTTRDRHIPTADPTLLGNVSPAPWDEIMDPLTGELVPTIERDRMGELHRKLEEVALELLATCRQIRTALGDEDPVGPHLTL